MAGKKAERQETGLINIIKKSIKENEGNAITILSANKKKYVGIIDSDKFSGRQVSGSEPYIDVIFMQYSRTKINKLGLSLKGESAPSLAGGGLRGINLAVPGLADTFMKKAYKSLINMGLVIGDKVPDVYGEISNKYKTKIVVGNKQMGGPIDYMYIGPMDVKGSYDSKKNILSVNGNIYEAKEYAKTHKLFFRLRARREDQRFDPDAYKGNTPKIYGKSPSKGDSAGRIVVTDKVPSNAVIIKL